MDDSLFPHLAARFSREYAPFPDIVGTLLSDHLNSGQPATNLTVRLRDMVFVQGLAYLCRTLGFRQLALHNTGNFSMVLASVDGQLLRISPKAHMEGEPLRQDSPMILQPIARFETDDAVLEVMPEVTVEAVAGSASPTRDEVKLITREHVESLVAGLAEQGLFFWDVKPQNIGLLDDGTPVVIDAGAVVPIPVQREGKPPEWRFRRFQERMSAYWLKDAEIPPPPPDDSKQPGAEMAQHGYRLFETMRESRSPHHDWDGAQARHLASRGLTAGQVKGVVSGDEMNAYLQHPEKIEALKTLIATHGLYLPEAMEVLAAAVFDMGANPGGPPLADRMLALYAQGREGFEAPPEPAPETLEKTMEIAKRILAKRDSERGKGAGRE